MNLYKVILAQAKSMKPMWLTSRGSAGHVRFQGAKKRLAKIEELNALFANAVKSVINTNKL